MAKQTVVLTLGRLPVALDIARSFASSGWRVVVAEPFGMHLARMSRSVHRSARVERPDRDSDRYLDDLADIVRRENAALVVPVSEETPRVAHLRSRLPASTRIFADAPETVLALHDKFRFAELAARAGLPVAESHLPGSIPGTAFADLVIKPRLSCSGRGVRFIDAGDPVDAWEADVIQQRIRGQEFSGFAVCRGGRLLAPVVYRSRVSSGSVAVCFERVVDQDSIVDWMRRFVNTYGVSGFLAFDFIVDAEGTPHALECNPRATSGIHFLDQAAIATLILHGAGGTSAYHTDMLRTESWSCYTACLAQLFRPKAFVERFRLLHHASDVTWSRRDPWPFLLMPVNTFPIIRHALVARRTFAEVALRDVEWRDPAAAGARP